MLHDVGETHRERRGATCTGYDRFFTDVVGKLGQHVRCQLGRTDQAERVHELDRAFHGSACKTGTRVHSEVHAAVDHEGTYERHDRDERLHEHAAVTQEAGLTFLLNELRRGT